MSQRTRGRGRLAPIGFAAGLVLLGLAILVVTLAATGRDLPVDAQPEAFVVNGTANLVYAVPAWERGDDRLTVHFRFPEASGTSFALRCNDIARVRAGEPPSSPHVITGGISGSWSMELSRAQACPFLYVAFQWPAAEGLERNRPAVTIHRDSVLLEGPAGAFAGISGVLGAVLAATSGLAWGRRLNRQTPVATAEEDESAAEALLILLERGGGWLARTRRYLLLGGILGIFLWYPIVLPWTFSYAFRGTSEAPLPWVVSASILALLLALTVVWAREYLRLDRELHAWTTRMARLREREAALLSEPEDG